jgi:hypothetical protein
MKNNTLLMDFGTPTGSLEIIHYAFFSSKEFYYGNSMCVG